MLVSFNWLRDYVALDVSGDELADRLMMAGLNHEGSESVGDDLAIDLEVTSNRPDCLGHIGVAREAAVLFGRELQVAEPAPTEEATRVARLTGVTIECPELCRRYTARVIRGARIGPSPSWLVDRLATLGMAPVNNVVDATNYVLMECGQPLHAFDLAKLAEQRIVVREAKKGETLEAIDHKTYQLEPGMCLIADARRPVALGGVMGGADSEVSAATTELLVESAEFAPLAIRGTARKLNLHSPSSYRFERGVDPRGVDWASRRCCELILDVAGGELAAGVVDEGAPLEDRPPIVLRLAQLERILGIAIPAAEVRKILQALGSAEQGADKQQITVVPPSWRRDLTREIDLVEEAGRIHGYDQIPEDVGVRMVASARSDADRVLTKVRHTMTAAGLDEAMTLSAVEETISAAFTPWTAAEPIRCLTPVLRRADLLRRSLVPSLLVARRTNESLSNPRIELFEIARAYLAEKSDLPREEQLLAVTSGGDYLAVKGLVEALLDELNVTSPLGETQLRAVDTTQPLLAAGRSAELRLGDEVLGYLGEVSDAGRKQFELRGPTTVAELRLAPLVARAALVPRQTPLSPYPAVSRDLNIVVDESVRWADLQEVVRAASGPDLEEIVYQDTYRDPKRLGAGKKSLLLSITLRRHDGTLTREEADQVRDTIVEQVRKKLGGELRA